MRIDWNIAVQQRLLMALLALAILLTANDSLSQPSSPFDGVWVADLSQSKFHNNVSVKSVTLTFRVVLNTVTITDAVMLSGDKNASQRTTRFEVDGLDHPHDDLAPGLIATVEWRGARFLHTVLRRPRVVETVTYEVSPDGGTLVNATNGPLGEQRIVYRRR